ncbi:N-acetylglucosaminidase, partial [Salinicoccus roseus]
DASTEEDEADDTSDENEENDQREIITKLKEGPALFSFASISNDADSPEYSEASYAAKIKSARNSGIFSPLTNKEGVSAQTLLDHTLFINRRAIYKGDTYYLINREYEDRMQGWMKEKDLNLWTLSDEKRNTRSYALTNRSGALLTDPWGTEKQQKANLNSYGEGTVFQAEKTVNLGALTFHYGKLGNDYGWVQETKVKDTSVTPVHFDASYAAKIKSSNNSGVFSPLTRSTGVSARSLQNQTLYTDKKAVYKGDVFYLINREYGDRMQGWMKEKDLNLWSLSEKKRNTRSYALTNRSGALLTDPWGTEKQQKANLKSYGEGTVFQAEKTVNLGALTFHYGKLGNDYGWVQETKVKDTSVDPVYFDSSYAAKIRSGNNSGLYSPITSTSGKSANVLMDRTLFTNKKAVYKGNTFYLIYREYGDRMQGWMKEKDLNLWNLSEENKHNKTYSLSSRTGGLSTDPWGTSKQYINPLTAYQEGAVFQAEKTLNLGALTFHYGKIGNDYGWIQDTKLSDYVPSNPAPEVKTVKYNISLDRAVDIQMNLGSKPQAWANGGGWRNATRSEVAYFINPANHTTDTWDYTYLDLNRAQNISTVELNNKLLNNKGILHNQGTAFLQAANTHGVNEVYLISHALHETGNGQSTLAQGVRLDANGNISSNGKLYYNMYGIAAYDHNPVLEGARYAQRMGWDTPAKAVIGGAQFISGGYFNRGQNTLYAMRWNPANPGTYQYATDVNWAYATARNLKNYYDQLGIRGQYYTRYTF